MTEKRPCDIESHGYGCMTGTMSHDLRNLTDTCNRLAEELRRSASGSSARLSAAIQAVRPHVPSDEPTDRECQACHESECVDTTCCTDCTHRYETPDRSAPEDLVETLAPVIADAICGPRDRPRYSPDSPCTAHQIQARCAAEALAPTVARLVREGAERAVAERLAGVEADIRSDLASWINLGDAKPPFAMHSAHWLVQRTYETCAGIVHRAALHPKETDR